MKNKMGIATYYILTLLLGSVVVGLLVYQVYRTTSFIENYQPPELPTTIVQLGVSSSVCQAAQEADLCDGLNIAYGSGYKEECCANLGKCCD